MQYSFIAWDDDSTFSYINTKSKHEFVNEFETWESLWCCLKMSDCKIILECWLFCPSLKWKGLFNAGPNVFVHFGINCPFNYIFYAIWKQSNSGVTSLSNLIMWQSLINQVVTPIGKWMKWNGTHSNIPVFVYFFYFIKNFVRTNHYRNNLICSIYMVQSQEIL